MTMSLNISSVHAAAAAKRHFRCPTNKRMNLPHERHKFPISALFQSVKPPSRTLLQPQSQAQAVLCPGFAALVVRVFVLLGNR